MITTTREAVNALDLFHQSVIDVMIDRGLIKIVDDAEKRSGDAE